MTYNTYNLQWLLNKLEKKGNVKDLFFWGHAPSKDVGFALMEVRDRLKMRNNNETI